MVGDNVIQAHAVLARRLAKCKLPRVDIDKIYAAVKEIQTGVYRYSSSYGVDNDSDLEEVKSELQEEVEELPEPPQEVAP